MDNLNENSVSFPNPPKHYKKFKNTEFDMKEPELENLQKLTEFISFGTKYNVIIKVIKLREINYPVLNFKELEVNSQNISIEKKNEDVFEELENEIYNLRKNFKILLQKIIEDVEKTFYSVNTIVLNFQKIYQIINKLKNKQILIKTRKYFQSEIDRNSDLEEQLKQNTKVVEEILNKLYYEGTEKLNKIIMK